jgi:hypothetical protein
MRQLVAERALEYSGESGIEAGFARVFLPFDEGQNWRCDYEIVWPGYEAKLYARGVDSWQALQLAMQIIPVVISATEAFKAGKLGWIDGKIDSKEELIRWLAPTSMDVLEQ